jgi:putative spermidine/putrescine transport system ATP-binding protein
MVLELTDISKSFGPTQALSDVSLAADEGEIISIIGPSGSGKTTLLRIIAGLENPDSGNISFSEADSQQNQIIMVFQDYVLFPHMTVFENVAFGLKAAKTKRKNEIDQKVHSMLSYFAINDESRKYPAQLSGGQRQRVAIARAMVLNPHILLLDEPFANLDKNLKYDTAAFIRKTQKAFGVTTVTVTHDIEEAFLMSDRIGILLSGRLAQFDSVENVYFDPSNIEAASFLGPVNSISQELLDSLEVTCEIPESSRAVSARAEGLELSRGEKGSATITGRVFTGRMILYEVVVEGSSLKVYSLSDSFKVGDRVHVILHRIITAP